MKEEHLKWLQRNSLCVPIKGLPVIGPYRVVLSHIKAGKPGKLALLRYPGKHLLES